MSNIKRLIESRFEPKMLLSIYANSDSSDIYVESHDISPKGAILEGKPLNHETVDMLLSKFEKSKQEERKPSGIIPEGLIYMDIENSKYIWLFKPQVKKLLFTDSRNIPDGEVMMPKLLFMANRTTLYVFALKSGDQLYRAPFHNTDAKGIVCQGSARANKRDWKYSDVIAYWEDIFFNSKFSHTNGGNPIKGDLDEFWRKAIESKSKKFDNSCLIKIDKKIEDLFK